MARRGAALALAPKHAPLVYHRAALTHFTQFVPLTVALGLALVTASLLVAVAALLLGEALLVGVVPRSRAFRRSVDHAFDHAARLVAGETRATLLARMSDTHLREFAQLERLAREVRERVVVDAAAPPEVSIERSLRIERLLAWYVRLAIAHRRSVESFGREGRAALEAEVVGLALQSSSPGSAAADWLSRRRLVLAKRLATWARAGEEREALAAKLATIADVLRWAHELCEIAAQEADRAEIDAIVDGCGRALAEGFHAAREDADEVDPEILELGRAAPPCVTRPAHVPSEACGSMLRPLESPMKA